MTLLHIFINFVQFVLFLKLSNQSEQLKYYEDFFYQPKDALNRNALKIDDYKWPNGIVYYEFSDEYSGWQR